jgi:hypothetical protein
MYSENPAEESILYLIPAAMGEFPLDQFPVLAVFVNKPNQEEIFLESPLFGGKIRP